MSYLFKFYVLSIFLFSACESQDLEFYDWYDYLPSANLDQDFEMLNFWTSYRSIYKNNETGLYADSFDYPVPESLYVPGSYANRSFYVDRVHLGEDIALEEGIAIRAIANGKIVFYGPANGYGELVVVIEHKFRQKYYFLNAFNNYVKTDHILSIYGHLRKSHKRNVQGLQWKVGDFVRKGQIIAYVNDDLHNGDGREHLHLGIRLQSMQEAQLIDTAWFRGYDKAGMYAKYFSAGSRLISANLELYANWHPNGTLLKTRLSNKVYLLKRGKIHWIKDENVFYSNYYQWEDVIDVSESELNCYSKGEDINNSNILIFQPNYNINVNKKYPALLYWLANSSGRLFFNSIYTLYSWGIRSLNDVYGNYSNHLADKYMYQLKNLGAVYLRDGTLFMPNNQNKIYIVHDDGIASAFQNFNVFFALKYRKPVLIIDHQIIKYLIRAYGEEITEKSILQCKNLNSSILYH